jgi:hypothetical protein
VEGGLDMDTQKVAERIEIATRNNPLFSATEAKNRGIEDRKEISMLYKKFIVEKSLEDSLRDAKVAIIKKILNEERGGTEKIDYEGE